eukprot:TRINITY_DN11096_c0_g1_i1.p1 TRINITY_DN11096_c0_g1~~TRINITY_DN11096_c0_g1_i1.p1  ORF type:complete len:241 (-),score=60.73 TRINITY_DN11096_c0_g1_i1:2-724(-)
MDISFVQHPRKDKIDTGGEDTLFISDDCRCISVFDGVGGWAARGISSREYALKLSQGTEGAYLNGTTEPIQMLIHAESFAQETEGSSTATLLRLQEDYLLKAAHLGDCTFIILRDNTIIFKSEEQTFDFNTPYQIGSLSDINVETHAEQYEIQMAPNDIIVLGSDGLFDNLNPKDIVKIVRKNMKKGVKSIATKVGSKAKKISLNPFYRQNPITKRAKEIGDSWRGGKQDDITVIVAQVK